MPAVGRTESLNGNMVRSADDAMRAAETSEAMKTPWPKGANVCTSRYESDEECERAAKSGRQKSVVLLKMKRTLNESDLPVDGRHRERARVNWHHVWVRRLNY
jgi:hypothetical protein